MKLIVNLFNTNRNYNISIVYFVFYCLSLLLLRVKITQSVFMLFLVWNLVLAGIPYLLLLLAKKHTAANRMHFKLGFLLVVWLLFLPNSFYIVTDWVHLTKSNQSTLWLDVLILASFSSAGFFMGILSLLEFESIISNFYTVKITNAIIPAISFLSGFGIYLGRVLRYNSWDIISNPKRLVFDMGIELASKDCLFFSALFGFFIYSIYLLCKITKNKTPSI